GNLERGSLDKPWRSECAAMNSNFSDPASSCRSFWRSSGQWGVPLDAAGNFSMPFFTDFGVRGHVGLLDWYTVSVAIFAVVVLAAHGATYLKLKTEGPVHDRSATYAKYLWWAVVPLFVAISMESWVVRPEVAGHAIGNPFCWLGLLGTVAAA